MDIHKHVKVLQTVVALLLDKQPRHALHLWNSQQLQPKLRDVRLSGDGETLVLAPVVGVPVVMALDDVIGELEALMAAKRPEL